ncbi:MAG: hypothetical protein HDS41_06465 [Bacteroides sp.]|nr:hypothetical protein [Bacteroides sp.]
MKQILFTLGVIIASSLNSYATLPEDLNEEYGQVVFSANDPEYEWTQIDTKQIKVSFTSQSLQFESKDDTGVAYSVAELPISVEDTPEFIFGFNLKGFRPSDNRVFGMIFDYQDIRNYKAIAISKKTYQYYVVKDGVTATVKSGPVKFKGDSFKLIMRRENGGIEFQLNGIEVCKLRKISLTSSFFGVFISGKGTAEMPDFIMYVPEQEDTEVSTSNT